MQTATNTYTPSPSPPFSSAILPPTERHRPSTQHHSPTAEHHNPTAEDHAPVAPGLRRRRNRQDPQHDPTDQHEIPVKRGFETKLRRWTSWKWIPVLSIIAWIVFRIYQVWWSDNPLALKSTAQTSVIFDPLWDGLQSIPSGQADALSSGFSSLSRIREALTSSDHVARQALINATDTTIRYHEKVSSSGSQLQNAMDEYKAVWATRFSRLHKFDVSERIPQNESSSESWVWALFRVPLIVLYPRWGYGDTPTVTGTVLTIANELLHHEIEIAAIGRDYRDAIRLCSDAADDLSADLREARLDNLGAIVSGKIKPKKSSSWAMNLPSYRLEDILPGHQLVCQHAIEVERYSSNAEKGLQCLIEFLDSSLADCKKTGFCQKLRTALEPVIEKAQEMHEQQMKDEAHSS